MQDDIELLLAHIDSVITLSTNLVADVTVSWSRKEIELKNLHELISLRQSIANHDEGAQIARASLLRATQQLIDGHRKILLDEIAKSTKISG